MPAATFDPVISSLNGPAGDGSLYRVTWSAINNNAALCTPVSLPGHADKSVQVFGIFGSASVAVHGSNDAGVTYAALNDPTGTVIAITAAKIKAVLENTEFVRPVLTGGDATQNLNVVMLVRLSNPKRQ